jgi:hypothetical protein
VIRSSATTSVVSFAAFSGSLPGPTAAQAQLVGVWVKSRSPALASIIIPASGTRGAERPTHRRHRRAVSREPEKGCERPELRSTPRPSACAAGSAVFGTPDLLMLSRQRRVGSRLPLKRNESSVRARKHLALSLSGFARAQRATEGASAIGSVPSRGQPALSAAEADIWAASNAAGGK